MQPAERGGVSILRCGSCGGLFLAHEALGALIEEENDWHRSSGPRTEPLPRITTDMTTPPRYEPPRRARSYIDELFA
jgi:Zn-finger nucleic acid-binding protein